MVIATDYVSMIDAALLKIVCPERTLAQLEPWVAPIKAACIKYNITTIRRIASFIAQIAHESSFIPGRRENLNYSAKRLAEVWVRYAINPKALSKDRLPNALAKRLAGNPQAIANNVYADRMGNGPEALGNGYKTRGCGPGQLTGLENFINFGKSCGKSAMEAVDYAATIEGGVASFAWFWNEKKINPLADTAGVEDETQKINGGQHGVDDRRNRTNNGIKEMIRRERLKRA
jgi:putative chitinase